MKRLAIIATVIGALGLASVALAATPSGTYKTVVTSTAYSGALKGTWTVKFASGAYTVTDDGTTVIHGKYTVSGSKMTFQDKSGKDKCAGKGVYKFSLHGSKLTFTKVSDGSTCVGRVIVLTSHTLTKT